MTSEIPKFNLLYYKALLDKCFVRFFDEGNSWFQKSEDGGYVLAKTLSRSAIEKIFAKYLKEELTQLIKPYSLIEPNFYLIIGACIPKDNLLLKYKDASFSKKLEKTISENTTLKYILKEKDIKLDILKFNAAFISLFNKLFRSRREVEWLFGKKYKNVIFVSHSKLDCYSMFKVIKHIYGRANCWNVHREKLYNMKSPLVAINDLIDRSIRQKAELNKSKEFKMIVAEVQQFLDEKVREVNNG